MNKLKLLYDVVKTLKGKEAITGLLMVEVQKDQTKIFSLQNEFNKNMLTHHVKAKLSTELDYEGKAVKLQGNSEFTMPHCSRHGKHSGRQFHHHNEKLHQGRFMGKLAKLAFAFSVLDALQATKQDDGTFVLALNANDLPEEIKIRLREKIARFSAHHAPHNLMKECDAIEQLNFVTNMFINKNYEVEKIAATLTSTRTNEQSEHDLNAQIELSFAW